MSVSLGERNLCIFQLLQTFPCLAPNLAEEGRWGDRGTRGCAALGRTCGGTATLARPRCFAAPVNEPQMVMPPRVHLRSQS